MSRLRGKVAIITGAASGQGAEEARLFAKEGAKVVLTDVQEEKLEEVAKGIEKSGGEFLTLKHNVADKGEWDYVIKQTLDKFGRIDILINNAGIISMKKITEIEQAEYDRIMGINTTGVFLGIKAVLPQMIKQNKGSIVNISSLSGVYGIGGAAYVTSKTAIRGLTKNVALDYGKYNIRSNSIHPGTIETPMIKDMLEAEGMEEYTKGLVALPYIGQPEDVAYAAVFLASDEAKFISGSELIIDGGALTM